MTKRRQKVLLLIADNQPVFLKGLADVFRRLSDIKVVAQCRDGREALNAIRTLQPDVAMIDIGMPGLDGLDVLAAVNAEGRSTHVLLLAATVTEGQILGAVSGGARGIVFKNSTPEEIARSVRRVAAGRYLFPKDLAEAMRRRQVRRLLPLQRLTPRELEVARLAAKGLSNKEIGRQIHLSEGTVKIHLHNTYKKLGVSNRTALAAMIASR
ncbi:MAG TPA: response regulator transcription factor [Xanthobacteraceae bacterium]|nr:response regulator transcription factor [Xanthobacteraceae bacterium]